jgi:phosphohistidine phosphatase
MRRLMLLRHAKSDRPSGVNDHERPLASRGRHECEWMGVYMAQQGLVPNLAIVSTARRAQETWNLVRAAFPTEILQQDDRRIYDGPAKTILDLIGESGPQVQTLLLVGHNPRIHELALGLVGAARQPDLLRLQEKYPTAGLAVIDFSIEQWPDLASERGQLERFESPRSVGVPKGQM